MSHNNINCLIVTYNRLDLLKESIAAVCSQSYPLQHIIIVNNNSTDGTENYLSTLAEDNRFMIFNLPENVGGAGGFSFGIKQSVMDGCDWTWVMDDDTIPEPNALEELAKGSTVDEKVGFVCSRVVWTDGHLHKMNIPGFAIDNQWGLSINHFSYCADVFLVYASSFVSVLISTEAVYEVGLPIKEFFIWQDDSEFTFRMYQAGYFGLYAGRSVVVHKTTKNYSADLRTASTNEAWKFFYGLRNETYLRRRNKKNKLAFYISTMNAYRRSLRKIAKRPKEEQKVFKDTLKKAYWAGISFHPEIERMKKEGK